MTEEAGISSFFIGLGHWSFLGHSSQLKSKQPAELSPTRGVLIGVAKGQHHVVQNQRGMMTMWIVINTLYGEGLRSRYSKCANLFLRARFVLNSVL